MPLTTDQIIGITGAASTVVIGVASWFTSAWVAKRSQTRLELSYRLTYRRILPPDIGDNTRDIKVEYKDELLPEPVLLSVDVINTGNVAIKNPPIDIEAVGTTYVIPGWFEDIPAGYNYLWNIERTDAESCAIRLDHINVGQTVKARFWLDEYPDEPPVFSCPMPDLNIRNLNPKPPTPEWG